MTSKSFSQVMSHMHNKTKKCSNLLKSIIILPKLIIKENLKNSLTNLTSKYKPVCSAVSIIEFLYAVNVTSTVQSCLV